PIANGFVDYFTLINERDGGINGVKLAWEECETQYDTKQGVECYERLKGKGPTGAVVVNPYSTGISYQLIPKAPVDKTPILQVRRINPDWIFMSGWGVMNQVAIKEAAAINFKMDHFIGNWWSANDSDVVPAADGAKGYKGATFHAPGTSFKVFQEVVKNVYD